MIKRAIYGALFTCKTNSQKRRLFILTKAFLIRLKSKHTQLSCRKKKSKGGLYEKILGIYSV